MGGDDGERLIAIERDFVLQGREGGGTGLALSGGGIRSAAFSLGVLQALVAAGRLEEVDYISAVSGGGYTATSLTHWLHLGLPTDSAPIPAGTSPENFPFGNRSPSGENATAQRKILDYLRFHSSYLEPTPALGLISGIAVVGRASFVSLFVYFSLLTSLFALLIQLQFFHPLSAAYFPGSLAPLRRFFTSPPLYLALLIGGFLAVGAIVYAVSTRFWRTSRSYAFRTGVQRGLGVLFTLAIGLALLGLLPIVYASSGDLIVYLLGAVGDGGMSAQFLAVIVTVVGGLLGARVGRAARPLLALCLVLYGLLVGALAQADALYSAFHTLGSGGPLGGWAPFVTSFGLLVVAVGLGWVSNINYLGLHRLYRDRLMELFCPEPSAIRKGSWQPAVTADAMELSQVCGAQAGVVRRPYLLLGANVVLVSSEQNRYRGRGGASFLLSPLYCGSSATGWVRTDHYMTSNVGRGLTLASAMAISGASVNPNAGQVGRGLTRSRVASAVLSLLNLRLGYFAPNPARERSLTPNFLHPGLSSGIFGRGLHERSRIVELTDGGHFENLGLYELIRRRLTKIVVCDAGFDADFHFGYLGAAVERIRVDFGVKIEFDKKLGLDGLVPQEVPGGEAEQRRALAARAFARATIVYPDAPAGVLIFVRTTLFPGLPADVLAYALTQPEFPNQSTADQLFTEEQFEAYRELGYHAGWNFIEADTSQGASSPLDSPPEFREDAATVADIRPAADSSS